MRTSVLYYTTEYILPHRGLVHQIVPSAALPFFAQTQTPFHCITLTPCPRVTITKHPYYSPLLQAEVELQRMYLHSCQTTLTMLLYNRLQFYFSIDTVIQPVTQQLGLITLLYTVVHCTLYTVHCCVLLYTVHCTLYTVLYCCYIHLFATTIRTDYTVVYCCPLYIVHCTLLCTVVHCTLYPVHCFTFTSLPIKASWRLDQCSGQTNSCYGGSGLKYWSSDEDQK